MNTAIIQLLYTLETTLLFSMVTIGIYVAFRILRFPDLTAEGGFGLAAIVCGMVMLKTQSPWLGLAAAIIIGACTGIITALLTNIVRLPTILASILTMTMCFSVGLLIADKPSVTLPDSWVLSQFLSNLEHPLAIGIVGMGCGLGLVILVMLVLMRTGVGYILHARGENPNLTKELGSSLLVWDIVGLAIANGIVGLAAAMLSQRSGYASINMGRGIAISALASIMLGEAIFPSRRLSLAFIACIGGTFLMQLVRLVALNFGMPDGGLDLVTSLMVISFCWLTQRQSHQQHNILAKIRM